MRGGCDDFGDGLALFGGDEDKFFEQIFGVIALNEGYHVGILFRGEASYGYSGALTLVSVLPELPVGSGKVEGREDLPVVLFYGGFEIGGQIAEAVLCSGVRGDGEQERGEEESGEGF